MSWEIVKACTVAITTSEGKIGGTGFYISSEGHLLTCAHVIEAAGGWQQIRVRGSAVTLIYLGNRTQDDFAILQTSGYEGSSVPLSSDFEPMDRFLSVGFGRSDFPDGASIDGVITDENLHQKYNGFPMIRLRIQADSQRIKGGYSGSPVFNTENKGVIGIIAASDHTEGALAVPVSKIREKLLLPESSLKLKKGISSTKSTDRCQRIFISYRSKDPDLSIAQAFYEAFQRAEQIPFMAGASIRLGEKWGKRIDEELERCDYFLLLLSPESANSEMVLEEVRRARKIRTRASNNKPVFLPIRVNLSSDISLNYELRSYLGAVQHREWRSSADTINLVNEILSVISEDQAPILNKFSGYVGKPSIESIDQPPLPVAEPELPGGLVDIASRFYIKRQPIETDCYTEVVKPGSLILIKAPRQMGKTSLMSRILCQAEKNKYHTASLSFQLTEEATFESLDKFLYWFCVSTTWDLNLPFDELEKVWKQQILNSKIRCSSYFERYLLQKVDGALVLAIDEIDLMFERTEITREFLGLLRTWFENGKKKEVWKKLRLILVHSTEVYVPLKMNQSPFNVGLRINLSEFSVHQVIDLARRHGLDWHEAQAAQLMSIVGGHPYLVRVALYHIHKGMTLDTLLKVAATEEGPFRDHLLRHLWNLEKYPTLLEAVRRLVISNDSILLNLEETFKLKGMGLIRRDKNNVSISFELYRQYFRDRLRIA